MQARARGDDVPRELRELRAGDVGRGRQRRDAGLVVLAGRVDLQEDVQRRAVGREVLVQARGAFGRGDGLDGVEVGYRCSVRPSEKQMLR